MAAIVAIRIVEPFMVKPGGSGSGNGRSVGKTGEWELEDHVNGVCCFNSKLEGACMCLKFDDFFCGMLQLVVGCSDYFFRGEY